MDSPSALAPASELEMLRRENAMLRETLDAIDGTVVVYSDDLRYRFGNRAYHELFPWQPSDAELVGRSYEELLGASIDAGMAADPDAGEDRAGYIARRVTELRDRKLATREIYHRKLDRWWQIRAKWTPSGNRVALRIDITGLKRLQKELLRAHRMETIGRVSGGVAHDFNNLLTIITGNLEMIRMRANDPARVTALAGTAMSAAENGAKLIRQLLTFAQRDLTQPRRLNPNQLLSDMADLLRRTGGFETAFSLQLGDEVGESHFDSTQFESAVVNLVLNAREALAGCEEPRLIKVSTACERLGAVDYVAVSVADSGAGMTDAVAAQAFEPFFTTKPVGSGPGLGLSQVHGFASGAGGWVRINSAPGQGTTVTILLPRCG